MKCFVDISLKHKGGIPRGPGTAEITISADYKGETHTRKHEITVERETIQTLAVRAVVEALRSFKRPGQDIVIRMRDPYVRGNWKYMEQRHEAGWKTKAGKEYANAMEWRQVWMAAQNNRITFEEPDETM